MKNINRVIIAAILLALSSCTDIIDCEKKYDKEYTFKALSPEDSLKFLDIREADFGSLKMRTTSTISLRIINKSDIHSIKIFSLATKNTTGLFTYKYPFGLPFAIEPGEDTEITGKITAKFIADVFNTGFYYDTLIINNDKNFYISVRAKVRY